MLAGRGRQNIPVSLGRAALAWPSKANHGHQPLSQEERALFAQGSSLRNSNSALLQKKLELLLSASSLWLQEGKLRDIFCITNNQHRARVLCGQGCSWCPRFGCCSGVLVISGLHRDWGLSRAVGRWDLLMSVFVMR